jgi:hypothetical protein
LSAQLGAVLKLLVILVMGGALANSLAPSEPPLLIDSEPAPPSLDAPN